MEKGFYKADHNLIYAPNRVLSRDYTLEIAKKDDYDYPVNGWSYFETREEALSFFGIEELNSNN